MNANFLKSRLFFLLLWLILIPIAAIAYEATSVEELAPLHTGYSASFENIGEASIAGISYEKAYKITDFKNYVFYLVSRKYDRFEAEVGIRDDSLNNKVEFYVANERGVIYHCTKELADKPTRLSINVKDCVRVGFKSDPDGVWINPRFVQEQSYRPAPSVSPAAPPPPAYNPPPSRTAEPSSLSSLSSDPVMMFQLAQKLADQLKKSAWFSPEKKIRVAIAAVQAVRIPSSVADDVREDLSIGLVKTGAFTLVERAQLDKVLRELKIESTGIVDVTTAKKLGKMTGADVVLIGSISDRGHYGVVNARLIDTEKGESEIADSVELRK
jgi:TolB-like protein